MFPLQDSPDKYINTEIDVTNNSIFIPASLIQQRAKTYGMLVQQFTNHISKSLFLPADNLLPIANIIYFNLENFLPRTDNL